MGTVYHREDSLEAFLGDSFDPFDIINVKGFIYMKLKEGNWLMKKKERSEMSKISSQTGALQAKNAG